jgi:hypothetical protein
MILFSLQVAEKAFLHEVVPCPEKGWYEVVSGTSGARYVITPLDSCNADCTCAWGRKARCSGPDAPICSHVLAVRLWARKVLRGTLR